MNKFNNSVDALYPSWESNSCSSGEFDSWWKTRFASVSDASTTVKVIFANWDASIVQAELDAEKCIVQMLKGTNSQVIEGKLSILSFYFGFLHTGR